MEALVFILLIIFVVVNSGKKNKKAPAKPPAVPLGRQAEAIMEELRQTGRLKDAKTILDEPPADPAAKAAALRAKREAARKSRRPAPVPAAPAPEMAFAGLDAEGCVGGSMAHDHHEGEGRAEHARHLAAMTLREEQESRAAQAAREMSDLTVRRLRQAVVMAEVLDRPVALRRRREWRVKS